MRMIRVICAVAMLCIAGLAHADTGSQALQHFYQKVHTLSARFHQVQRDDNGNLVQKSSGSFYLSRPKKFRWEYKKPYHQIMVSNGKVFKFYDVGLAQVTVRNIGATLRATPALLLTGGEALDKAFKIADAGNKNGMSWVKLTPRKKDTDFASVDLGLKNNVPKVMKLHDNLGQITTITFSHVKINPKLAASRFTLNLPKNVEVVDGRANSGQQGGSAGGNQQ